MRKKLNSKNYKKYLLKNSLKTLFLFLSSYFVFRWVTLLLLIMLLNPFFILFGFYKLNRENIIFPLYHTKFPLFSINIHLINVYKYIYSFLKTFSILLTFFLALIVSIKIYSGTKINQIKIGRRELIQLTKLFMFTIGAIFSIIISLTPGIIIPFYRIYTSTKYLNFESRQALASIKNQQWNEAETYLEKANDDLNKINFQLNSFSWLTFVPYIKNYYSDTRHVIKSGLYGLRAASIFAQTIQPYEQQLNVDLTQNTLQENQGKIVQALGLLEKINPNIDPVFENLHLATNEISNLEPKNYPEKIGSFEPREKIKRLVDFVNNAKELLTWGQPLIKITPQLLGYQQEKKYLLLFQNNSYLRPAGGYITSYGVFQIKDGKLLGEGSFDINSLDKSINKQAKIPTAILSDINPNQPNIDFSPDFKTTAQEFGSLYHNSTGKNFDGIIVIDSQLITNLLRILGPTVVQDKIFSVSDEYQCSCPQVVYEIQMMTREQKKDIVSYLVNGLLIKSLSAQRPLWLPLIKEIINSAKEKHLMIYFPQKAEEETVESLGIAGDTANHNGDYLLITNTSLNGEAAPIYSKRSVRQDIEISNDKSVTKTLTLHYSNPYPTKCHPVEPSYCFNQSYDNLIRIYVPKNSELVTSEGAKEIFSSHDEGDKTVLTGLITLQPLGETEIKIKYRLPFKAEYSSRNPYSLFVQKQSGINEDSYEVYINSKIADSFYLDTDRSFNFLKK